VKILADTCVWSLLLRRKQKTDLNADEQLMLTAITDAILNGQIAVIGPIRQEILSGIKETAQFDKLRAKLEAFHDEQLTTFHFEEAARLSNLCRRRGVECGSNDILICAVAIQKRWKLLTSDQGLKRCIETLQAEGQMQ
jgi:predicted nucleic acid-binding protein